MNSTFKSMATAVAGIALGVALTARSLPAHAQEENTDTRGKAATQERKILYWVAPMDPNYKRDKPGKSPMGMDLIPVYDDAGNNADSGPGTVTINPDVVNNLGVRTAPAERRALHGEIRTVGYVRYDEDHLVHIHPRVTGWIEKLYLKAAGDPVQKGDPMYALYSPELVNAQEELSLALNRGNRRLIDAATERLQALQVPVSVISGLKQGKPARQTVTFYAPQSGVVDNLNIREGFYVQPGTTLMSIGVLDPVWVDAEVFERQAGQVKPGLPVTMSLDYLPGRDWQGNVDYIYPTLDPKTRTLKVRLRFANPDHVLKPNMFAQVVVHADGADTLVVPREAVIRTGSQDRVVLALGNGRFKSVAVKVGRLDERYMEICEGLDAGDDVVTSAQFLLDSESSKTSDFRRMHHGDDGEGDDGSNSMHMDGMAPAPNEAVWVGATIRSVMAGHRMLTVSHQPIKQWGWPSMTMDFDVAEGVDMSALQQDMAVRMEVTRTPDKHYSITAIQLQKMDMPMKMPMDMNMDPNMNMNQE